MNDEARRILILGGTGFVGRELGRKLCELGYRVAITARQPERVRGRLPFPCDIVPWGGGNADLPPEVVSSCDGIINLVGEGIADKPWSNSRRHVILSSRVESAAALARAIKAARRKPSVVIQASAIGYYGDRGDERLHETSAPGQGFLAKTCLAWEQAAAQIEASGVRVVRLRLGLVLGLTGGALPKMLSIYAKGLGGTLGDGRQWVSWIHVDDLTEMIAAALASSSWQGAVNAAAPSPCRYEDLNTAIGRFGRYFAPWRIPRLAVRATMGARSALVLDSVCALPHVAAEHGFKFRYETIEAACRDLLGDAVASGLRRIVTRQWIAPQPASIWPFFSRAENLERLTPPWLGFKVLRSSTPRIDQGTVINYALRLHGFPVRWESEICDWKPGQSFVDMQRKGPYAVWHHTHQFEPLAGGTLMTDCVQYRLPLAPLGEIVAGPFVERDVERIFTYRSSVVASMGDDAFEER